MATSTYLAQTACMMTSIAYRSNSRKSGPYSEIRAYHILTTKQIHNPVFLCFYPLFRISHQEEESVFFWTRSASNVPRTLHIFLTQSPLLATERHHSHCYKEEPRTYRHGTIGTWRSKGRSSIVSVGWVVGWIGLTYHSAVTLFFHYNSICVYIHIPPRFDPVPKLLPHGCQICEA
jgi:hypothetical protein